MKGEPVRVGEKRGSDEEEERKIVLVGVLL